MFDDPNRAPPLVVGAKDDQAADAFREIDNLLASLELPAGARVLGFNYDTGERYLSVEGYLPA